MAINFPNSPSVNDIHVSGANRWQWNGSSWTRIGGVSSDSDTINSSNDNSTTTLYPVMVTGTGDQTAKISTSATKNISFDASDGNLTVGGNISVGGTITYEDVTNVDSVGVVTARSGVKVTGGDLTVGTAATISSVGNITAGIVTAASGQLISGVGIDTSGTVVGYAATIIHFRGPGVSTAYYSATTGVGTVYFQGGGGGSASVSISESAPSSPSAGDMWWDSDVGNLQIYYTDANSSQWVTANNAGPQGPQGAQGATGAQGAQGYQGVQGSVGIASLTISTGAPSSPAAGDMWWDSDDGDLHLYFNDGNSSQWVNINAGSAGAQGVQGAAGSNGAAGAQGAQGAAGASGAVTDAQRNTKAGTNAGDSFSGTDATDNTLIGYDSGTAITTGDKNTLVGSYAGDSLTSSSNVTAIGYYAASTISTQSAFTGVTAVGSNACKTSVGQRNTVVGFDAFKTGSSGGYNCILGNEAARQSDGSNNIVIGDSALLYGTSTASYNIALGRNAFVGSNSNHASSHSISIGYDSMYNANRTTAWGNIAIGSSAGKVLTTGFNNIIIGDSAEASAATENNEITLGNSNHVKFRVPGIKFEAENDEYHFSCDHNLASYVQRFDGVWGNWAPNFNFKATGASPSGTTLGQWGNHQNGHALTFVKSRNNGNSGTSCQAGDDLGSIFWSPFNSANPGCSAAVKVMADSGTWSSTSNPAYMQIMTTPNGSKEPTERLRITSAGKVGIGTDDPVGNLEVRNSKANLIVAKDGLTVKSNSDLAASYDLIQLGAGGALASYSTATATADTQFIHNAYRHSGNNWKYRYADTAMRLRMNSPGGAFIFESAASGSADADITFSERLRIDSAGRIGLNGTTPVASHANVTSSIYLADSNTILSRTGNQYFALFQNLKYTNGDAIRYLVNGYASAYVQDTGVHKFFTTAASGTANTSASLLERLRIDSSGRVGINETTPQSALHLGAGGTLRFERGDGTRYGKLFNDNSFVELSASTDPIRLNAQSYIRFDIADGEKVRITSAGQIGIGLNNPSAQLHLAGPSEIRFNNATDAGNWAKIQCFEESGNNHAILAFSVGSGEALRIANAGYVNMPNQPAFKASGTLSFTDWNTYEYVTWGTENYDNASAWNGYSFTCPTGAAGDYLFQVEFLAPGVSDNGNENYILFALFIGTAGQNLWRQDWSASTNRNASFSGMVLQLAAGDVVRVALHKSYGRPYTSGYTSISGCKLN